MLPAHITYEVVTFNMMVGLSTPLFGMLLFITSGICVIRLLINKEELYERISRLLAYDDHAVYGKQYGRFRCD